MSALSPGLKWPDREADCLPSAEFQMREATSPFLHTVPWCGG